MLPCDRCKGQAGRPGHLPPHPDLEKAPGLSPREGATAHAYQCRKCGHMLVLQSPGRDMPDFWVLGDGAFPA